MKAEERKEIETNSLVLLAQKIRQRTTGRTLYYLIGTVAIVIGAILLYRYLTGEKTKARDAGVLQLYGADTTEKLKQGMEDHRGTTLGAMFKMQLARRRLLEDGLPKLGTESADERKSAANYIEEARTYFLELTGELKQKEEADLVQEAWLGAAQAEEALVGLPTAAGGTDSRGNADKAIEYYDKAAAIFPDTEFSKRHKAWADKLRANKEQWVAAQKAMYKPRELPPLPPAPTGKDPLGRDVIPPPPKGSLTDPKIEVPPLPPTPKVEPLTPPKTDTPSKGPDAKEPPKTEPKAK
jgi:hypothetical protein